MRKTILAAIMTLAVSNLQAQWKITGIDKSENNSCELVQVLESDNSTFVFGTVSNPSDDLYPYSSISRSACVYVDDEPYKLINSVNLPVYDEATPVYARISGHQKMNFILEFEKFPVTDGFDLLEKESRHTEGTYNFYGIHIENVGLENMAGDTFLDEYPAILYGEFTNEGKSTQYYMAGNVTVSCIRETEYRDQFGQPDYVFYLTFENGSNKVLKLHPAKDISVIGYSVKANGKEEKKAIKLIRQNDYETYFHGKDYQAARRIVNGDVAAVSEAASEAKNKSTNSDVRAAMGLVSLVGTLSTDKQVKEYMKEHPSDRPSFLTDCSIESGEKKSGYVGIQTKKMDYYVLHLNLDGSDYAFTWK